MGVGSGRAGGVPPLDFHTWNKYNRERLKSAISCFSFFSSLWSIFPLPPLSKRESTVLFFGLGLLFFGLFISLLPPLENFLPTLLVVNTNF